MRVLEIFFNVFYQLGYDNLRVNNGYFLNSDGKTVTHSWLEGVDCINVTNYIIETTPDQFNPGLLPPELYEKLLILPEDPLFRSYKKTRH